MEVTLNQLIVAILMQIGGELKLPYRLLYEADERGIAVDYDPMNETVRFSLIDESELTNE